MNSPELFQVALTLVRQVGPVVGRQLIQAMGSAQAVFEAPPGRLLRISGVGPHIVKEFHQKHKYLLQAEKILENCNKAGIFVLDITHTAYPLRLRQIPDAPLVIYTKGNQALFAYNSLALVGTRTPTPYGYNFIDSFLHDLSQYSQPVAVISGLAYGIDAHAHRRALEHNIPTIAVLANGLDRIYPRNHTSLARQILSAEGLLISEYPPYTQLHPSHFLARNRIIAGLSDFVLVVESRRRGGAMTTARLAQEYDREVGAVPGPYYQDTASGCHELIKQHVAHLIDSFADVCQLMSWSVHSPAKSEAPADLSKLEEHEKAIVIFLSEQKDHRCLLDTLCYRLQMPLPTAYAAILELELKKLVHTQAGQYIQLTPACIVALHKLHRK